MYIFTDGITEIKDPVEMLGAEGFQNYIKKYQSKPNNERLKIMIEDIVRSGKNSKRRFNNCCNRRKIKCSVPKDNDFFCSIISAILYWATSNVCRYNFALEKRTNILNIVTDEIDPILGNAQVYFYQELNCNHVDLEWDLDRVMDNLKNYICNYLSRVKYRY